MGSILDHRLAAAPAAVYTKAVQALCVRLAPLLTILYDDVG